MISTSGHLIPKFPEVRFHRTRIFNTLKSTKKLTSFLEEEIDMCKAIDDMLSEREARGELRILVQLVREGDLKVERAAVKAKLTVEQFKKVMESDGR